jgi:hypothetical protein
MEEYIECPNCKERIPLSEALTKKIDEANKARYSQELKLKEEGLRAQYESQLTIEKAKVTQTIQEELSASVGLELEDLRQTVNEQKAKLEQARIDELEHLKKVRALQDKEKEIDLTIERKLSEERQRIEEQVIERLAEERRFKEEEKDKQLSDLKKQVDELRRRLEQGSQQTQGEVAELHLEEILKFTFPLDQIEPVGKGISGADLLQRVHNSLCRYCGSIIWEVKNTKNWSDQWIEKLKDDQRIAKAEMAILVTAILPKGAPKFSLVDGIWVTDFNCAIGLATALRGGLIEIENTKIASTDKSTKIDLLFTYLTGNEFKQRIEGIVDAFNCMQEDLNAEKRAVQKLWAKREKQILKVIENTAGMYGDVQGIVGSALPKVDVLELPASTDHLLN